MGNYRMIFFSVVVALLVHFSNAALILKTSVSAPLVDAWNQEIETITKDCGKKPPLPANYVVEFGDTEEAIGYCQHYPNGFKIVLKEDYWNRILDKAGKRQLLLHEMMHCIFYTKHNTEDPNNFMYPEFTKISEQVLLEQVKVVIKASKMCD